MTKQKSKLVPVLTRYTDIEYAKLLMLCAPGETVAKMVKRVVLGHAERTSKTNKTLKKFVKTGSKPVKKSKSKGVKNNDSSKRINTRKV